MAADRPLPIVQTPPDPELDRDAEALYDALSELTRVYAFRDRDRICCFDVSVSQCYALEEIVRRGGPTLNELAAHLYLDKSTTSRVVDGLERKGYAVRAPHPEDGRALRLRPTPAGERLLARIRESILEEERDLISGLDPAVRRALPSLLRRLARAAAARVDTAGGTCCRLNP
jgi:DNA-binding MarR family transcriptional regulator